MILTAAFPIAIALTQTVPAAGYPELTPEALLPAVVAEMKRTLADPSSVRDLVICPPKKVKLKDGKPASFAIKIGLSAKNLYGAYAGRQYFGLVFRQGRVWNRMSPITMSGSGGLTGLINDSIARDVERCERITSLQLQRALGQD